MVTIRERAAWHEQFGIAWDYTRRVQDYYARMALINLLQLMAKTAAIFDEDIGRPYGRPAPPTVPLGYGPLEKTGRG